MTEDVAALRVRIEATTNKLERALQRANQRFDRGARQMENRAQRLDTRLSRTGSRFGGPAFQNRIQQAGFQVGDFAVQVASGQSAMRAFIQQGTQMAGAFGPIGAVIGAVGAVVGALATSLLDSGNAASSAAGEMNTLSGAMELLDQAGSRVDSLNADIARSSGVLRAALIKERDATVDLLRARLELARQTLSQRNTELEADVAREARTEAVRQNPGTARRSARTGRAGPRAEMAAAAKELADEVRDRVMTPEVRAELAGLERQIAQTTSGLEKLEQATETPTGPIFSGGGRSRSSGGSSRSSSRSRSNVLSPEVESLMVFMAEGQRDIDNTTDAMERQRRESEELNRSLGSMATRFANAMTNARSFGDVVRGLLPILAELAVQAVQGQGVGSTIFNSLAGSVGSLFGSRSGSFTVGDGSGISASTLSLAGFANGGAFMSGRVRAFARGGVVDGPTLFPMRDGAGLMGEAGPEAIMPLSRGRDGKLGVKSAGGGSSVVNVEIVNEGGGQAQTRMDGNTLRILIPPLVAENIANGGVVGRAIRQSFSISPSLTQR